jgi:hypothetical protein
MFYRIVGQVLSVSIVMLLHRINSNLFLLFYSHVKIREYKNVPGKCYVCSDLSSLRRSQTSLRNINYCTALFALHKSAAMGERMAYDFRYERLYLTIPTTVQ